jgi:UDP-GlcNAc:undecaprenyl-phosphate/decaprenyl-phosphate GlcNAc-1-phosphate transferase
MTGIPLFLFSSLLCFALIFIARAVFSHLNWLDKPERFGYFRKPVPYGLGIVLFLTFVVVGIVVLDFDRRLLMLIVGGGVLTTVSFWDDRFEVSARMRLVVQIVVATAIVVIGDVSVPAITNPFGDMPFVMDGYVTWLGPWLFEPVADCLAIFWLVLMMNAMNWLDGVPGMVSGMSTIAFAVIFVLASAGFHVIDQQVLSQMTLILGASTFVFWFFDFPKPRVLMGDSGTMFLGLMLGVMAIYSGAKFATAIVVLAFPVFDFFWTIGRRLYQKRSPFKGDFEHFHHVLRDRLMNGRSVDDTKALVAAERKVCWTFYAFSIVFGGATLLLGSFGKFWVMVGLLVIMVLWRLELRKLSR